MAWFAVGILLLLAFVSYLDRQIIALMVGMIKADLGVSDSQIGLLQGAAFSVVFSLAALPFGYAVDRWSRRVVIVIGVTLWALMACACGLADSFPLLLAARMGVGLGEAALGPATASIIADMFPKKRLATAFSVAAIGTLLGSAGAYTVGGAVLHWAGDGLTFPVLGFLPPWKVAFLVTGLPGLVLAWTIFLIPEPKRRRVAVAGARPPAWHDVFAFMRANGRFFGCYLGGFASLSITAFAFLAWTPALMQRSYGWAPAQIGLVMGPYLAAVGVTATLTNGHLVDRLFGRGVGDAHARYYMFGALVLTVFGAAAGFAASPLWFLILLVPMKFVVNFGGVANAGLQILTPDHLRGRVAAAYVICTGLTGATLGPSIVAFFTDVVFRDESKLHLSISVTCLIFGPLGALLFAKAMAPMRRAVAADAN